MGAQHQRRHAKSGPAEPPASAPPGETWFHTALRSIGDGVIATDNAAAVLFMNSLAEKLTGWPFADAVGMDVRVVYRIVNRATREAIQSSVVQVVREGKVARLPPDVLLISRDGAEIPIEDTVAPIRTEEETITGAVIVFRDITDRVNAAAAALQQQRRIEELNHELQIAMVETHHRIRTNLQFVASLIESLQAQGVETVPIDELQRLALHVRTLAAIHELLMEKMKSGEDSRRISVTSILNQMLQFMRRTTGGRLIRTRLEGLTLPVKQSTSLMMAAAELVNNAIKHGTGEIEVKLTNRHGLVTLEVTDSGPGFAADFDRAASARAGLELVETVAHIDLAAETRYENREEGGARVTLRFRTAPA